MADVPQTNYARNIDGLHIAYQAVGEGPPDVVLQILGNGHLEMDWEIPAVARFIAEFASFSRVLRFNPRGTGVSDPLPVGALPTLEDHAEDLLAVLDALGLDRIAVFANGPGGLSALYFAASYPDRITALVLDACYARLMRADDYPFGVPAEILQREVDQIEQRIVGDTLRIIAPSVASDPEWIAAFSRGARSTLSPAGVDARSRLWTESDVRSLLPAIRAPTLVTYRSDDRFAGRDHARYLADHITDAKLVALPGRDTWSIVGDTAALIGEVQEFLTGTRPTPELNRVLATVLFTDIVASTDRVAEIGDREWGKLLDRHDELVAQQLERFRGRLVKSTGDGVLATFDGPAIAIRCAEAIARRAHAIGLQVRAGIHTGEVELRNDDLAGIAVHIAQRICSSAEGNQIVVSRTVIDLTAGSDIHFDAKGEHQLKGVPGTWPLFAVAT